MLSGHLCRCTGYEPIVEAILEAAGQPSEPRAVASLRGRAHTGRRGARRRRRPAHLRGAARAGGEARRRARRAGRRGGRPRRRGRPEPPRDGAALLGLPVARRRLRPAVLARSRRTEVEYCVERTPARALFATDGDGSRTARSRQSGHPGALEPRRARAGDHALHVGDDRPAEGRAALPSRRARGRALAGDPARLSLRRPHARRDAALPHDGRPLAARDEPDRRLLRLPGELGCRAALRPDRGGARSRSLYLAPTLFHDLVHARRSASRHLVGRGDRLRGRRR